MRTEEYISIISNAVSTDDEEAFGKFRKSLPLGLDEDGKPVCANVFKGATVFKNLCVTGACREDFICRTLIALSCLYERDEATFLLISPNPVYAELLRLNNIDAVVPYIRSLEDVQMIQKSISDILRVREYGTGYPRLFLVLDGLEELPCANRNKDLAEYMEFFRFATHRSDMETICGMDLTKSIFSGCPGGFLGIGNCLVKASETGKANVSYVRNDASLSSPRTISYPSEPSVADSVKMLNDIGKSGNL